MTRDDMVKFLNEAASYFEKRPTGGEDMAFWSNVTNAENCRKIAAALEASAGDPVADGPVKMEDPVKDAYVAGWQMHKMLSSRAAPPAPVAAQVKPLNWLNAKSLNGGRRLIAVDVFGNEFARIDLVDQIGDDIDVFKAAKQADYEQLIRSALVETPAPVAAATAGWVLVPEGQPVTLAECPIGLFEKSGEICLRTEYGNNEGRIDAYIVSSGEFFWGDAPQTIVSQRAQIVQPLAARPATPAPAEAEEAVWTEGVCGDGAVFLKDGVPQTITQVLGELNAIRSRATKPSAEVEL